MTGIEPQVLPKKRYTISEACELLGIHRNTLRRKTEEGEIKAVFKKAGTKAKPMYEGLSILKYWRATL